MRSRPSSTVPAAGSSDQAAEQRRADIEEAFAGMRRLSKKVGAFDSTAVIRADRDSDYGNADIDE
jgi:hypothetical protein